MTPQLSYIAPLAAALAFGAAAIPLRAEDPALEEVTSFPKQQVTGVAVSAHGRVFVNFPFWSDDHTISSQIHRSRQAHLSLGTAERGVFTSGRPGRLF